MSRSGFAAPFVLALIACSAASGGRAAESACAAGDDDRTRAIPAALLPQARTALGLSADAPDSFILTSTVFRCMDGRVFVCTHGANLTCAKANRAPVSSGAADWCRTHANADFVPAVATGHDAGFSWKCVGGKAVVTRAATIDRRGFLADEWKPL